jgi:hypothetical protein
MLLIHRDQQIDRTADVPPLVEELAFSSKIWTA